MVKSVFHILASDEANQVALLQQTSFVAALRKQIMLDTCITKLKKVS